MLVGPTREITILNTLSNIPRILFVVCQFCFHTVDTANGKCAKKKWYKRSVENDEEAVSDL